MMRISVVVLCAVIGLGGCSGEGGKSGGGSASGGGSSSDGGSLGGGSAGGGAADGGGSAGGGDAFGGGESSGGGEGEVGGGDASAGGGDMSTGGGAAGGGSSGGGSAPPCNSTQLGSAPLVAYEVIDAAPPVPTGGTIVAGRYQLVSTRLYTDAGTSPRDSSRLVGEISGTGFPYTLNLVGEIPLEDGGPGSMMRETHRLEAAAAGTQLGFKMTCPLNGQSQLVSYSATATRFELHLGSLVQTLTKQ